MKFILIPLAICFLLPSCKPSTSSDMGNDNRVSVTVNEEVEKPSFFPVTSYILGQMQEIREGGMNPLRIQQNEKGLDSVWLKMEELPDQMKSFLSPKIDTTNLVSIFKETKFMDNTLNAITLTYDAIKTLPDSLALRHWDVYIDPETNNIRKIYMVKQLPQQITEQLTWIAGKQCNIKWISEKNGKPFIEKDVIIKWSF